MSEGDLIALRIQYACGHGFFYKVRLGSGDFCQQPGLNAHPDDSRSLQNGFGRGGEAGRASQHSITDRERNPACRVGEDFSDIERIAPGFAVQS